jgi:hypothetical protein
MISQFTGRTNLLCFMFGAGAAAAATVVEHPECRLYLAQSTIPHGTHSTGSYPTLMPMHACSHLTANMYFSFYQSMHSWPWNIHRNRSQRR